MGIVVDAVGSCWIAQTCRKIISCLLKIVKTSTYSSVKKLLPLS